ncbi:RHS repeat-associated core domain-containing protein [Lachnospiraceae bacterium 38-10]
MEADSGLFGYRYDALNRLTEVSRDGQLLRRYAYDAFGNRTLKEDYSGGKPTQTTYRYNGANQLIFHVEEEGRQDYAYDRRGNLTAVSRGEERLKAFTFDAANRMDSALQIKGGTERRAKYRYDAFGNRSGQTVYSGAAGGGINGILDMGIPEPKEPEKQISYTIDLTRQYRNVLAAEDNAGQRAQTFYWDGNVAAMEEAGQDSYYLQDDLGSPVHLLDGEVRESYGFDEFGQALFPYEERQAQPFGYTGYQMEEAGGLYFAQARRYDAGAGRFVSEDKLAGNVERPFSLNRYGYCWDNPLVFIDLDGNKPKKIKEKDTENIITEINCDSPTVTFCVDSPEEDSRNAISYGMDVGHTFIIIDYGNGTTYTKGFYPESGVTTKDIILRKDVIGKVYDDTGHEYNESLTYQITEEQADELLEFVNNYNEKYNMISNNCTTFAVKALESIGIDVPTTKHTWTLPNDIDEIVGVEKWLIFLLGGYKIKGYSPGDAAMDIKEFKNKCGMD